MPTLFPRSAGNVGWSCECVGLVWLVSRSSQLPRYHGRFSGLPRSRPRDAAVQRRATPRLVLQITVDQLRGDLLTRHYEQFGQGGFRFLLDNGVVYGNAHHAHANTETIVGHADFGYRRTSV